MTTAAGVDMSSIQQLLCLCAEFLSGSSSVSGRRLIRGDASMQDDTSAPGETDTRALLQRRSAMTTESLEELDKPWDRRLGAKGCAGDG